MTSFERPTVRPEGGRFLGFDHCVFWVGNAKQAAAYYIARFGFTNVCYRGLETGHRQICEHVIRQNKIVFTFQSPLEPDNKEFGEHLARHGDGVRSVAFTVDDATAVYNKAISRGAISVFPPREESDADGKVVLSAVKTYGDTVHTFVQRQDYHGPFLPNYRPTPQDPLTNIVPPTQLDFVDHIVGNQPDGEMENVAKWYENCLDFHRFWSVDDKQIHTEYSSLRSVVMADFDEVIKMPINEPAVGRKKSQIQEYVEYYGGAGVQHIALNTQDIITSVERLRARGVEFLSVPDTYYDNLRLRLSKSPTKVVEDISILQKHKILVDYDDQGYLLQIFTKPVEDRPTLFFEIIQRRNHQGFGAGNFKALFESIERDQAERGNL